MLIGEVARRSGLTRDTVRFYERTGLIHSSPKQAGTRVYNDFLPDTLERLAFIKQGQAAGFTLREIKTTLNEWGTDLSKAPVEEIIKATQAKLKEVEEKLLQLEEVRSYLVAKIARLQGEGGE